MLGEVGYYIAAPKCHKRSIPVTRKTRQLKKEEPHDKIEVHLAGCNNPIKPEVHHELYTE